MHRRIRDRPPSASVARDLFRLRKNRFDALRLRTPAAKARFAAATAKWSSAEFRRLLRQLALNFNGDRARAFPGGGASALEPGVFYGFEDAVRARRLPEATTSLITASFRHRPKPTPRRRA